MRDKWEAYLSREISIKYKAGLYSLCHLFYCACYLLWQRIYYIGLLQIAEITLLAYLICNLQVYVLKNFDEGDRISASGIMSAVFCSLLYILAVHMMNWFDRSWAAAFGFGAYQLFCYYCIYLINKIKRRIDSRYLNQLLQEYKERK